MWTFLSPPSGPKQNSQHPPKLEARCPFVLSFFCSFGRRDWQLFEVSFPPLLSFLDWIESYCLPPPSCQFQNNPSLTCAELLLKPLSILSEAFTACHKCSLLLLTYILTSKMQLCLQLGKEWYANGGILFAKQCSVNFQSSRGPLVLINYFEIQYENIDKCDLMFHTVIRIVILVSPLNITRGKAYTIVQ